MDTYIGWLLIGGATLLYVNNHVRPTPIAVMGTRPSVEREVDVTRWRHDGTQPMEWTRGNAAAFRDETVYTIHGYL